MPLAAPQQMKATWPHDSCTVGECSSAYSDPLQPIARAHSIAHPCTGTFTHDYETVKQGPISCTIPGSSHKHAVLALSTPVPMF